MTGTGFRDDLDRWGADFNAWPDRARAAAARQAVLADRSLRAYRDALAALARGLAAERARLDHAIASGGHAGRVGVAVQARLPRAEAGRRRLAWIAAAMLVAAVLGSAADFRLGPAAEEAVAQVVVLEPLLLAPPETP